MKRKTRTKGHLFSKQVTPKIYVISSAKERDINIQGDPTKNLAYSNAQINF